MADRRQIVIFPEGARWIPVRPIILQPGVAAIARQTGLPVIPVATDSGICWGRRSFRKSPGTIHILILPRSPPACGGRSLIQLRQALEAGAAASRLWTSLWGHRPQGFQITPNSHSKALKKLMFLHAPAVIGTGCR